MSEITYTRDWPEILQRSIVAIWAAWISVVFLTNFLDGLKELGILSQDWTFASGNYQFFLNVLDIHGTPEAIGAALFAGGVVWEFVAAVLLVIAVGSNSRTDIIRGFTALSAFFGAFMILTEVFIAYDLAATHIGLFTAQLVSVGVVLLLIEQEQEREPITVVQT